MYLFSHLATTIIVTMININNKRNLSPEDYQIWMVVKGSLLIEENKENYILNKNDIILLQPHIKYNLEGVSDNTVLDISIPVTFFRSMIKHGYDVMCNSTVGRKNDYPALQSILTDIIVYYNKEDNHLKMCSLIYSLMDCMNEKFLVRKRSEDGNGSDQHNTQRIEKIVNYINTNYLLPLNLQTLSDHMFLSPQYLSKLIKQNFGMNFNKYLNKIRMDHALEELKGTDHSIITIAFNNGFASTTSFNKLFKEMFHIPPTSYRQSFITAVDETKKSGRDKTAPVDTSLLFTASDSKNIMPGKAAFSYMINTADKEAARYPWLRIINFGLAQNVLSHIFRQIFTVCQSKLNFEYARIENIFSNSIITSASNSSLNNYTVFDDIINFLIKCNIYPLFELGNKPTKIFYSEEEIKNLPDDYERVISNSKTLEVLIKHSINRYGLDYVSHWKFELWIPQDENLNLMITPGDYMNRYITYSKVLQKYLPGSNIGGPGFNASGNPDILISIIKEFNRQNIRPGFISIYMFPYESGTYNTSSNNSVYRILSPDPQRFKKVSSQLKDIIRQIFKEPVPLYITVYNSIISPELFVANSAFQAAFICKNAVELMPDIDAFGYWLFTDITNEYMTAQPNILTGIGLIDAYGIKKPSYFALEFLSRLGTNLISSGPNYIMTSSNEDKYQILAYNYVHYNKYFCINCRETISCQNTYSVFETGEPMIVQFDLHNLPAGRYKIRKHILNRNYGSFLDEIINILDQGNSTPDELFYLMLNMQVGEVEYYKNICIPRQEISYVDCEENLNLFLTLAPHEVNYISISRKI